MQGPISRVNSDGLRFQKMYLEDRQKAVLTSTSCTFRKTIALQPTLCRDTVLALPRLPLAHNEHLRRPSPSSSEAPKAARRQTRARADRTPGPAFVQGRGSGCANHVHTPARGIAARLKNNMTVSLSLLQFLGPFSSFPSLPSSAPFL